MKSSLLFAVLLLLAYPASAQRSHRRGAGSEASQGYMMNGLGSGASEIGRHGRAVRYEPPRNFVVGYAVNDGPFVPSKYMSYDEALALGQRQLNEAQESARDGGTASLGDIARAYRTYMVQRPKLDTRAIQDNAGKIELCNLNGTNCRRI